MLKEVLTKEDDGNNDNPNELSPETVERIRIRSFLNVIINTNRKLYDEMLIKQEKNVEDTDERDEAEKKGNDNGEQKGGTVNNELKYVFDNFTL